MIFAQPWWLDAVAPGQWGEVRVEKGGECHARLPYHWVTKWGLTFFRQPPLTQKLGPWLRPYPGKYNGRLGNELELMTGLIAQLPPFHNFCMNFDHRITNWMPFCWKDFQQTTRYTYVLDDLTDPAAIWEGMRDKARCDIRKAKKQVVVRSDLGLDELYRLCGMTFTRQGLATPFSRELLGRIDRACEERQCRRMFFAEDAEGRRHAALYLIWDADAAYYLIGGGDPDLRNSGATSLLMWEAIQHAATVTRSFDFEGSMLPKVEPLFRAFGARQVPYFQITKNNSLRCRLYQDIRSWGGLVLRGKF